MKPITHGQLFNMSIQPIKRAISNWIVRCQVKSRDRHIDVLRSQIKNDQRALSVIELERALLARRLR